MFLKKLYPIIAGLQGITELTIVKDLMKHHMKPFSLRNHMLKRKLFYQGYKIAICKGSIQKWEPSHISKLTHKNTGRDAHLIQLSLNIMYNKSIG
jgi:hypothetical protein